jgi:hypothetical protein
MDKILREMLQTFIFAKLSQNKKLLIFLDFIKSDHFENVWVVKFFHN